MIKTRKFYYLNKNQLLSQSVTQLYKRKSIPCGFNCCVYDNSSFLSYKKTSSFFIPSCDVLLNYKSILFSENVILLQSVLENIKIRAYFVYFSLMRIIEKEKLFIFYDDHFVFDVDHNDTIIRACTFYSSHRPDYSFFFINEGNFHTFTNNQFLFQFLNTPSVQDGKYAEYTNQGLKGTFYASYYNYFSGYIYYYNEEIKEYEKYFVCDRESVNRAVHGDKVYFMIVEDEAMEEMDEIASDCSLENKKLINQKDGKFACITGIIRRRDKVLIGSVIYEQNECLLVKSIDKKYPPVRIKCQDAKKIKNQRIKVMIREWPKESKYPYGNYLECIGPVGKYDVEIKCFFLNNEILENGNECLDNLLIEEKRIVEHEKINLREILFLHHSNNNCSDSEKIRTLQSINPYRVDLTDLNIFSIDPPGCTDIDDCLSIKKVESNENKTIYQVGVHIADVSSFVSINSLTDKEAFKRCTSVYLNNRRIDMLPELLSSELCSLQSNKLRLSLSVMIKIEIKDIIDENSEYPNLRILSYAVHESVIKSKKSFTYEQAFNTLNLQNSEFHTDMKMLFKISQELKRIRKLNGALTINNREIIVRVNNTCINNRLKNDDFLQNLIIDNKQNFPTCSLIEEFMVLCNCLIAEFTFKNVNNNLLRRHPINDCKEIRYSKSEDVNRMMLVRSMAQAVYCIGDGYIDEQNFVIDQETAASCKIDNKQNEMLSNDQNDVLLKNYRCGIPDNKQNEILNDKQGLIQTTINNTAIRNKINHIIDNTTINYNQIKNEVNNNTIYKQFIHYGLAVPLYTHFTSPIRRYADLIVHRIVKGIIYDNDYFLNNKEVLNKIIKRINDKKRNSQIVSRECNNLFIYNYLRNKEIVTRGFIVKKLRNGSIIYLPEYDIDGFIRERKEIDEEVEIRIIKDDNEYYYNRWIRMEVKE